jgi:hypothetical protein
MAARMAAFDWAETPLGAPDAWPQSLRTAIRIMLTSRYAMWMAWGQDLTFFCNDAYLPTLGAAGSEIAPHTIDSLATNGSWPIGSVSVMSSGHR